MSWSCLTGIASAVRELGNAVKSHVGIRDQDSACYVYYCLRKLEQEFGFELDKIIVEEPNDQLRHPIRRIVGIIERLEETLRQTFDNCEHWQKWSFENTASPEGEFYPLNLPIDNDLGTVLLETADEIDRYLPQSGFLDRVDSNNSFVPAPSATEAPFVPIELQRKILEALDGVALTKEKLAAKIGSGDGSAFYKVKKNKDGTVQPAPMHELKSLGKVMNKRGLGYYRPDAPPKVSSH